MKKIFASIIILTFNFLCCTAFAENEKLTFSPEPGISVQIQTDGQKVTLDITNEKKVTTQAMEIETEKSLKLITDDYNFDGHSDFSVSHLDDGMGTYKIYQIYIYSNKDKKFHALQPKCGDEFINISLSKKNRSLINSYYANNQLKTCATKY
jgi:hypothetical protein